MPAENFIHIYNCGINGGVIFKDNQDYEVFESYLKDYLSPLLDTEKTKKTFVVKGRTYRGTPHLPKNYLGKIELEAYCLVNNHFHLLIKEIVKGSQVSFLRSLCTRYSIFFNKKYKHRGGVFDGPYKSIEIEDLSVLPILSRYINTHSDKHSSIKEYLGERTTPWIKPETVLSRIDNYKNFVRNLDTNGDQNLLRDIVLEKKTESATTSTETSKDVNDTINLPLEILDSYLPIKRRIPEIFLIGITFVALLTIGIKNINASTIRSSVLSAHISPTPTSIPISKQIPLIVVKINDGSETVAIRKSSSFNAQKIAEAHDGEKFEFLSFDNDWYKIRLPDNFVGFIYSKYISKKGGN